MRILLPNRLLKPAIDLLEGMSLKPSASRARTKLITLLKEARTRFSEDEYQLVCEYATLDSNGKPAFETDGGFTLADPNRRAEFFAAHQSLLDSNAEISGPTYEHHLQDVQALLSAYDTNLAGDQAEAYDALYDAVNMQERDTRNE